jgi:hypothetical protein
MIQRLITNGCSYMHIHAQGAGHLDLANLLNIKNSESLAISGSCNSRIIRTTLQDCYATTQPTLYIIGLTFFHRYELSIRQGHPDPDGKWVSFTGTGSSVFDDYEEHITKKDLDTYADLYAKFLYLSEVGTDLQWKLLSLIDTLHYRGHRVVIFNTAEGGVDYWLVDNPKFDPLRKRKEIINGLAWRSIPWQFEQGARWPVEDERHPLDCRHVVPGDHKWLNQFLIDYIKTNNILT